MSIHFKFDTFAEMLRVMAESIRPAERMTVAEAAEKYRILKEATHRGNWDNTIATYLVDIMNSMESLEYRAVVFAGPARCGKSDIFFNWLAYATICDPGDIMLVHMTQSTARDWSQGDLRKAFRHSTALGARVLPGKQSMNTHDIQFTGMRLLVKWPSVTEMSGKTLRRTWGMDYDRWPLNIDGEGSGFDLTAKRTQTFGRHGMSVFESSPGHEVTNHRWIPSTPHEAPPTEGILSLYNRGDRRRWYWFCAETTECGKPFEGDFRHFNWPQDEKDKVKAASNVTIKCPHCGYDHTHDPGPGQPGKIGLNRGGRWIKDGQTLHADGSVTGEAVQSDIASFWLKGVAAAFVSWSELLVKYLTAMEEYERTGDTGPLKTVLNTDLGHPFLPPSLSGDRLPEDLMSRAEEWEQGTIPAGVRYLTAAIDVQKNRFVVQVHGHGVGGDTFVVDRFDIKNSARTDEGGHPYWVSPHTYHEDWHLLIPGVIEKTYALSDGSGRHMRIKSVACDSGGREGVTPRAYAFWKYLRDEHEANHHRRFQLVKGASSPNAPRVAISNPDSERKDRHAGARGEVPVLMINPNLIKDQVDGLLGRETPFGGMIHFAKFLKAWFYTELTVEVKTHKGWENLKKLRNEAWDLLVYDFALNLTVRHVGAESIDWDNPPAWADEWDDNDMVFLPLEGVPFTPYAKKPPIDLAKLAEQLA